MSAALLFEQIQRFHDYTGCIHDCKTVLLIENCSAYGKTETLPDLANVVVMFIPLKYTSKIQLMNASIIAALKLRCSRFQVESALNNFEADVRQVYTMDILVAMQCFDKAWNEIPASLITN